MWVVKMYLVSLHLRGCVILWIWVNNGRIFAFIGMFVLALFLLCAMSFVINWIVNTNYKKTIARLNNDREEEKRVRDESEKVLLSLMKASQEKLKRESVERIKQKEIEHQKQRYRQGVSRSTRSSNTSSTTSSRSSRSDYYSGSYGSCGGGDYSSGSSSSSSGSDSGGGCD